MYQTLFAGKPSTFLLMLAVLPTLISLSLMFVVRVHQIQSTNHDKTYLNGFSLISILVASYLMFLILLNNIFALSQWAHSLTLLVLLILLSSPINIAIKARKSDLSKPSSALKSALIDDRETEKPEHLPIVDNTTNVGQELNVLQAMCTMNFWLLFVATLYGMGTGLATINNVSQIGESLGYTIHLGRVHWFHYGVYGIFLAGLEPVIFLILSCTKKAWQGQCSWRLL
ncbi:hypothetical protein OROGR_001791 [Orobanche gracilis]